MEATGYRLAGNVTFATESQDIPKWLERFGGFTDVTSTIEGTWSPSALSYEFTGDTGDLYDAVNYATKIAALPVPKQLTLSVLCLTSGREVAVTESTTEEEIRAALD